MSSAVTQSTPPAAPPEQDRMLNLLAWIEVHRSQLLAGVAVVFFAFGVTYLWRQFRAQKEAAANQALLELRAKSDAPDAGPKPADFLKVAEDFPSTTAAPRARLLAAGTLFANGSYAEAQAEFQRLLDSLGTGTLAAQAAFGVAASLDAQDKVEDAIARYQDVMQRFRDESVAPQARLALARIHQGREQFDAALRLYDEVSRDPAAGPFAQMAADQRATLTKLHPELVATNTPAAPVVPSLSPAPAAP